MLHIKPEKGPLTFSYQRRPLPSGKRLYVVNENIQKRDSLLTGAYNKEVHKKAIWVTESIWRIRRKSATEKGWFIPFLFSIVIGALIVGYSYDVSNFENDGNSEPNYLKSKKEIKDSTIYLNMGLKRVSARDRQNSVQKIWLYVRIDDLEQCRKYLFK